MSSKQTPKPGVYLHNGEILSSPPLTVKIRRFIESVYLFLGLYFTSFFALDPYAAAQNSPFNIANPSNKSNIKPRWGGSQGPRGGGGGGGGGGGSGPGGSGPRTLGDLRGQVDDIAGECKGSCC